MPHSKVGASGPKVFRVYILTAVGHIKLKVKVFLLLNYVPRHA
jgi:hypothetical protein